MPRGAYSPPHPRVPALGLPESHSVGAGRKTALGPARGQGGRCSGNRFLQSQAPPRSRSWLQAHPPALPIAAHPSAVTSWQGQRAIHHPTTKPEAARPGGGTRPGAEGGISGAHSCL